MDKIKSIDICRFELPLKKTLIVKNNMLSKREGLLISINTTSGLSGFGEISPLPFFHCETFHEAKLQIKLLKEDRAFIEKAELLLEKFIPFGIVLKQETECPEAAGNKEPGHPSEKSFDDFLKSLGGIFFGLNVYPSVRTGIEMAIISLLFFNVWQESALKQIKKNYLPVCRLITDLNSDIEKEIGEIKEKNFNAVKVKVGSNSLKKEIGILIKIKKLLSDSKKGPVKIRIDSNSLWDFNDAVFFGKSIGNDMIDYIEDPVDDVSLYRQFYMETGIPVALDEKLGDFIDLNKITEGCFDGLDYLKAIVIKPDFIGGFYMASELAKSAFRNNMESVLSNSFNSSLLISFIALFAGLMDICDVPLGLDSLSIFNRNLLSGEIKINDGRINLREILKNMANINTEMLDIEVL